MDRVQRRVVIVDQFSEFGSDGLEDFGIRLYAIGMGLPSLVEQVAQSRKSNATQFGDSADRGNQPHRGTHSISGPVLNLSESGVVAQGDPLLAVANGGFQAGPLDGHSYAEPTT